MQIQSQNIFIRYGGKFTRVDLEEIYYLQSERNFVRIHFAKGSLLILITLRQLEKELPDYFCRVHRSYIVNSRQVSSFDYEHVWFGKEWVPVSTPYRESMIYKVKVVISDTRQFPGISKFNIDNMG